MFKKKEKDEEIHYIEHSPSKKGVLVGIFIFVGAMVVIALINYFWDFGISQGVSLLLGFLVGMLAGFFLGK